MAYGRFDSLYVCRYTLSVENFIRLNPARSDDLPSNNQSADWRTISKENE